MRYWTIKGKETGNIDWENWDKACRGLIQFGAHTFQRYMKAFSSLGKLSEMHPFPWKWWSTFPSNFAASILGVSRTTQQRAVCFSSFLKALLFIAQNPMCPWLLQYSAAQVHLPSKSPYWMLFSSRVPCIQYLSKLTHKHRLDRMWQRPWLVFLFCVFFLLHVGEDRMALRIIACLIHPSNRDIQNTLFTGTLRFNVSDIQVSFSKSKTLEKN